ncbi:uncharacterized protein LOC143245020 [Tachypleus tridentatus]|uniref:uncharacterized protein LOC143245020 n=1 Tax=Tachypleus tridentatus TaxID=6853 RepID=UPI003FD3B152
MKAWSLLFLLAISVISTPDVEEDVKSRPVWSGSKRNEKPDEHPVGISGRWKGGGGGYGHGFRGHQGGGHGGRHGAGKGHRQPKPGRGRLGIGPHYSIRKEIGLVLEIGHGTPGHVLRGNKHRGLGHLADGGFRGVGSGGGINNGFRVGAGFGGEGARVADAESGSGIGVDRSASQVFGGTFMGKGGGFDKGAGSGTHRGESKDGGLHVGFGLEEGFGEDGTHKNGDFGKGVSHGGVLGSGSNFKGGHGVHEEGNGGVGIKGGLKGERNHGEEETHGSGVFGENGSNYGDVGRGGFGGEHGAHGGGIGRENSGRGVQDELEEGGGVHRGGFGEGGSHSGVIGSGRSGFGGGIGVINGGGGMQGGLGEGRGNHGGEETRQSVGFGGGGSHDGGNSGGLGGSYEFGGVHGAHGGSNSEGVHYGFASGGETQGGEFREGGAHRSGIFEGGEPSGGNVGGNGGFGGHGDHGGGFKANGPRGNGYFEGDVGHSGESNSGLGGGDKFGGEFGVHEGGIKEGGGFRLGEGINGEGFGVDRTHGNSDFEGYGGNHGGVVGNDGGLGQGGGIHGGGFRVGGTHGNSDFGGDGNHGKVVGSDDGLGRGDGIHRGGMGVGNNGGSESGLGGEIHKGDFGGDKIYGTGGDLGAHHRLVGGVIGVHGVGNSGGSVQGGLGEGIHEEGFRGDETHGSDGITHGGGNFGGGTHGGSGHGEGSSGTGLDGSNLGSGFRGGGSFVGIGSGNTAVSGTHVNSDCVCVPYYQCKEGNIVTDGSGTIDPRKKTVSSSEPPLDGRLSLGGDTGCGLFHVCCKAPGLVTERPYIHQCGFRNVNGINKRIVSAPKKGLAEFGEWPWQGAVLKYEGKVNIFQCGAVLIDKFHVLTVAHCVYRFQGNNQYILKVRLGEWDTQTTNEFLPHEDYGVKGIVIHPGYDHERKNLFNDLAIIKLDREVTFGRHIDTVCLPSFGENFVGQECVVTGWGKDAYRNGSYSNVLREVNVPIIDNNLCQDLLRKTRLGKYFQLHDGFICAGGKYGEDSCKGDGGGPLMCWRQDGTYGLAGLVSWGIDCGKPEVPGVYINVQKYLAWIFSVTEFPSIHYWPEN